MTITQPANDRSYEGNYVVSYDKFLMQHHVDNFVKRTEQSANDRFGARCDAFTTATLSLAMLFLSHANFTQDIPNEAEIQTKATASCLVEENHAKPLQDNNVAWSDIETCFEAKQTELQQDAQAATKHRNILGPLSGVLGLTGLFFCARQLRNSSRISKAIQQDREVTHQKVEALRNG